MYVDLVKKYVIGFAEHELIKSEILRGAPDIDAKAEDILEIYYIHISLCDEASLQILNSEPHLVNSCPL